MSISGSRIHVIERDVNGIAGWCHTRRIPRNRKVLLNLDLFPSKRGLVHSTHLAVYEDRQSQFGGEWMR